jgi:hypothetical protein
MTERGTEVDFSTDAGDFKVNINQDEPSTDFTGALNSLKSIFANRLEMEDKTALLKVNGLESKEDKGGAWYKIMGIYTAKNVHHKMHTGKMRDADYVSEGDDPSNYPDILTKAEMALVEKALEEAELFVDGKRSQQELFADEE